MSMKQAGTINTERRTSTHQPKKHFSMMTLEELTYLADWVKNRPADTMTISQHFKDKTYLKIDSLLFKKIMESENLHELIIEYNRKYNKYNDRFTERVLIRGRDEEEVELTLADGSVVTDKAHLCFVVDLTTWTLITAYWNKASDHHETMDWDYYQENLEVIKKEA